MNNCKNKAYLRSLQVTETISEIVISKVSSSDIEGKNKPNSGNVLPLPITIRYEEVSSFLNPNDDDQELDNIQFKCSKCKIQI